MKAAQIAQFGHPVVININDVATPIPGKGEVLVEVHAASLNPFDSLVREGQVQQYFPLELPATLGADIAGVITKVGPGVIDFKPGDKVYGQANAVTGASGALAEYAVTSQNQIGIAPGKLTYVEAAALPLVGLSAMQVLQDQLNLQPGQKILIHGGAGAIGGVAVQLAKHIGAYVAVTATGHGVDYAKKLGADLVVDYKSGNFEDNLKAYDAVFDTVGGETYSRSFKVLKAGGTIVSMKMPPDAQLASKYGVTAKAQNTRGTKDSMDHLTTLVNQGVIRPHIGKVFTLDETREAFEARDSGELLGKAIVKTRD